MPSKNILLKFQNYLWFNFMVKELLISFKTMNALEIAELTNENLRREAHRLCYYMDAYVNSFTKHYSHLGELLGILNNLLESWSHCSPNERPLDSSYWPCSNENVLCQQNHECHRRI